MWTEAELYKMKKQTLQSLILPSVLCQNHNAAEILSRAQIREKAETRSKTLRLGSAGYLLTNFFKSHFFSKRGKNGVMPLPPCVFFSFLSFPSEFELRPVKIFRSHTNLQVLQEILQQT